MKKIFTLLMAMLMVLSASAMPAKKDAGKFGELTVVSKKDIVKQMMASATAVAAAKPARAAGDPVNVVCTEYGKEDYGTDAMVALEIDDVSYVFDIIYAAGKKDIEDGVTYTYANMDAEYTYMFNSSTKEKVAMTDAQYAQTTDADGLLHVVATAVAGGVTYNLTYDEEPKVEHTWGEWEAFAPLGEPIGTYTYNVFTTGSINSLPVQVRTATDDENLKQVKVSEWGGGLFSLYGVDFVFEWNTADNTCSVPVQETGYNHSTYGMVSVSDIATYLGNASSSKTFPCTYDPLTATFSLSLVYYVSAGTFGYSGDTKGHVAETLKMDAPAAPTTGDTLHYVIKKNAKWVDYSATKNWFQLYQFKDTLDASISTASSPLNQGEFFTADLDADFTFLSINGSKINASELHAIVSIDAANVVTGDLWLNDKVSGDVYHVTMVHDPSQPIPLDYDEETDFETSFATTDILANSASGNTKKTITFTARNANNEQLALTLYASAKDNDIVIPEGTYPINATKAAGTVLASTGVSSSSGSLNRSYVATIDEDGYLDKLWFLVGGTMKVEKMEVGDGTYALYMEIDAKNSADKSVKIVVGDKNPVGLTSVESKSAKAETRFFIDNARLVIERDGVMYNAAGQVVK